MKSVTSRAWAAGLVALLALSSASTAYAQRNPSRHHDDFPGAAGARFPGGMPTSEAVASGNWPLVVFAPPVLLPNPHTDWCLTHRPGYNPYDNTFQGPYVGERIYCRSPYAG
jgi:hypothetical protein